MKLPHATGRTDADFVHPGAPAVQPDSWPPTDPWVGGTSAIDHLLHEMLEREPYKRDQEDAQLEWALDDDRMEPRDVAVNMPDNLDVEPADRDMAIRARNMQPQGRLRSV